MFVNFYSFWSWCFWLRNHVLSFFSYFVLINYLSNGTINVVYSSFSWSSIFFSKSYLNNSEWIVETVVFKTLLSSLNRPVYPLDWPSNLSQPFLCIVTTACFISSNSSVPFSTSFVEYFFSKNGISANSSAPLAISFVDYFFSDNGAVTASSFLSPKNITNFINRRHDVLYLDVFK